MELVADDPVATVRESKQQDCKDIRLIGGAELSGALHAETGALIVKLRPTTIGTGIPLFSDEAAFDPRGRDRAGPDPGGDLDRASREGQRSAVRARSTWRRCQVPQSGMVRT
ncbi:hypothetical protein [Streptomyces sp. NPDC002403]